MFLRFPFSTQYGSCTPEHKLKRGNPDFSLTCTLQNLTCNMSICDYEIKKHILYIYICVFFNYRIDIY